jgi:hypothetical protein
LSKNRAKENLIVVVPTQIHIKAENLLLVMCGQSPGSHVNEVRSKGFDRKEEKGCGGLSWYKPKPCVDTAFIDRLSVSDKYQFQHLQSHV